MINVHVLMNALFCDQASESCPSIVQKAEEDDTIHVLHERLAQLSASTSQDSKSH